jgi:hypothetical protein
MSIRTAMAMLTIGCLCAAPAARAGEPPPCANGPVTQWTPESGGNGHFYQVVCALRNWSMANAEAIAVGRHLATITSEEENDFVFSLIDDESWWTNGGTHGPWIGGVQPPGSDEPAGGWTWVTGETFGFTAWFMNEPSNTGDEEHLHFYDNTGGGVLSAHWNDLDGSYSLTSVIEWEHSLDVDGDGEVQPLTDGLLILRRLFGFSDAALTAGAVDTGDCTRCDAAAIEPFLGLLTGGAVHDATADWSDAANPNGPWSYREGANALPHIASWQSGLGGYTSPQPGWARSENGTDRIPFFHQSLGFENFGHDYLAGDLVVHTWDSTNGIGNGNARLRFTVPATGVYNAVLAIWMGREISRSVAWSLVVNDVSQASGSVASGDGFSRGSPDGTNKSLALAAGDLVELRLDTSSMFGDYVGLRLRFEAFGIDVDGDGENLPLTDGLLVLRYLFGFTGPALITGAVDLTDCTRCDATSILAFLDSIDG